jgi:hypothetical protein
MMATERRAQIVDGVVVNVAEVLIGAVPPAMAEWPVVTDAGPGWTYDGETFTAPQVVVPVPSQISFRQLLIGLVAEGWITEAEGDAWLAGTIPAAASALVASLPQAQRFAARASIIRPSVILRADPLVAALAAAESKTEAELDTFFITYAQV